MHLCPSLFCPIIDHYQDNYYHHHYQDICNVGGNLSVLRMLWIFRAALPFTTGPHVHLVLLSSLPFPMHHFECNIGVPHPPFSCSEVLVELREWHAIELFILGLRNGRMALRQEQMALHAWYIFSDKLGLGLCILAFACYNHSH
jgi:hypothetical protein